MSTFKKVLAVLMIIFGMMIVGGVIISQDDPNRKSSLSSDIVVGIMFGVVPLVSGIYLFRKTSEKIEQRADNKNQVALLQYAKAHQNKITITEAALCLSCSVGEAKGFLDELQLKSVFEIELTEEGTLVYVLNPTLGGTDKSRSGRLV